MIAINFDPDFYIQDLRVQKVQGTVKQSKSTERENKLGIYGSVDTTLDLKKVIG